MLGLGMGGFVDGIVLHQIFQWHHLLSGTEGYGQPGDLSSNVIADGFFHVLTWVLVALGIASLWGAAGRGVLGGWRSLTGWMLVGWGTFNLVEGLINHHLLQIHRVRPAAAQPLVWDLGFLALGAVLVIVGLAVQKSDSPAPAPDHIGTGSAEPYPMNPVLEE